MKEKLDKISLPGEWWKQLKEDDRYHISNYGRVASLCGEKAIIRKLDMNQKGYLRIYLPKAKRNFYISRLVAKYFITDFKQDMVVHHIDGDIKNNNVLNLLPVYPFQHTIIHNFVNKQKRTEV